MRRPPRILVLDFGASHVAGAVFALMQSGELRLERFAQEAHAAGSGEHAEGESRAKALRALVTRERWRGLCALAVPGNQTLVKFISVPKVGSTQQRQVVQFEAAQAIPYPLEEVCWDSLKLGGGDGTEEYAVAAIKTEAMSALCAAVEQASLEPERAMPSGLAVWQAWRHNYGGATNGALVVDIGARSTELVFALPDRCFVRTLGLGGGEVMSALAEPLAQDEAARRRERFAQRLQMELARAIPGHARQPGAIAITEILLTGGGACFPGLADTLSAKLGLPVRDYDPLQRIELAAGAGVEELMAKPRLPVLTGLAAVMLKEEGHSLNLLPAAIQAELSRIKARPWWLAAAAMVVLAAVPPVWLSHRLAQEVKEANLRVENELAPLRLLAADNAENLAALEAKQREVEALRRMVAARSAWQGFMADLQRDLSTVGDVWLDRLEVIDDIPGQAESIGTQPAPLRLAVSGRCLDADNPAAKARPEAFARVKNLLMRLAGSRAVAAVENERFDSSKPGLLRFDFTLVIKAGQPL